MAIHDAIRRIALDRHVMPAIAANREEFSIAIRDLMEEAATQGISPHQRVPAFCRSIQTRSFLIDNGLTITGVDGPKSGLSTTVVVHYRINRDREGQATERPTPPRPEDRKREAMEAFEQMRGLLKDEIAAFGGAEAFIRWVRSDEDENAA